MSHWLTADITDRHFSVDNLYIGLIRLLVRACDQANTCVWTNLIEVNVVPEQPLVTESGIGNTRQITITGQGGEEKIKYRIDGGTIAYYSTPFTVNAGAVVEAWGVVENLLTRPSMAYLDYESEITTLNTSIPAPVIKPNDDRVSGSVGITLSSGSAGEQIFYTLDGSTPTENSTLYNGVITSESDVTVKAVAQSNGGVLSDIAVKSYDVVAIPAAPHCLSVVDNYVGEDEGVTLNWCEDENASYYQIISGNSYLFKRLEQVGIELAPAVGVYDYQLRACNELGACLWGNKVNAWVIPAKPEITPGGFFAGTLPLITMSTITKDGEIWYRIDDGDFVKYSQPFTLSQGGTIEAVTKKIVVNNGVYSYVEGKKVSQTYQYKSAPPFFGTNTGKFSVSSRILLRHDVPGTDIYYTLDGSTPTTASHHYIADELVISETTQIKAIAVEPGLSVTSDVIEASFEMVPKPAVPECFKALNNTVVENELINLNWCQDELASYYDISGGSWHDEVDSWLVKNYKQESITFDRDVGVYFFTLWACNEFGTCATSQQINAWVKPSAPTITQGGTWQEVNNIPLTLEVEIQQTSQATDSYTYYRINGGDKKLYQQPFIISRTSTIETWTEKQVVRPNNSGWNLQSEIVSEHYVFRGEPMSVETFTWRPEEVFVEEHATFHWNVKNAEICFNTGGPIDDETGVEFPPSGKIVHGSTDRIKTVKVSWYCEDKYGNRLPESSDEFLTAQVNFIVGGALTDIPGTIDISWQPGSIKYGQTAILKRVADEVRYCERANIPGGLISPRYNGNGSTTTPAFYPPETSYKEQWFCQGRDGNRIPEIEGSYLEPVLTVEKLDAPQNLQVTTGENGAQLLSWQGVDHALGYRIEERLNGGSWTLAADNITSTSYSLPDRSDSNYEFRVVGCVTDPGNGASYCDGAGHWSDTVSQKMVTLQFEWQPAVIKVGEKAAFYWNISNAQTCYAETHGEGASLEREPQGMTAEFLYQEAGVYVTQWWCRDQNGNRYPEDESQFLEATRTVLPLNNVLIKTKLIGKPVVH
ncbi:chitobiase/beta-hexosaminidase C-terminal domain-containing protein [Thalassomonas sp. RHCl1]|uniref:chitobiase/beta-hexosaminidase C-terminal domain-containing protein n=1 Tax=Thalassomonas sp. RHCl1 TaxID=2995320 RepID=UPI00248D232A|nr:chitobiase/beta-hexosaminidase C-terminal domain-containing protein [Thalassomonas sp. RHCl1]